MQSSTYILGVDPGLSEVGFGVLKVEGREIECVDYGIIKTKPGPSFVERLTTIKNDLLELISPYSIAAAGVEELFFVKNVTNGIKVAQARGVIVQSLHEQGILVHNFKPREIKQSVAGHAAADKLQVQEMVKRILKLKTLPKPHDAADALAVALCMVEVWKRREK
jgi:crossover junction endodeoxyribonuclease RuvC